MLPPSYQPWHIRGTNSAFMSVLFRTISPESQEGDLCSRGADGAVKLVCQAWLVAQAMGLRALFAKLLQSHESPSPWFCFASY